MPHPAAIYAWSRARGFSICVNVMLIALVSQRRAAEKQEKGTKTRAKKDPKAPKRALSAYMFFSQDWRERIKAENPDAGFGESLYATESSDDRVDASNR